MVVTAFGAQLDLRPDLDAIDKATFLTLTRELLWRVRAGWRCQTIRV